MVRLNGKNVLDGSWPALVDPSAITDQDLGAAAVNGWKLAGGQWFTVKQGDTLDLQIVIGDTGGDFSDYLLIEEKGLTYQKRRDDPKHFAYPVFQLSSSPVPPTGPDPKSRGVNPEVSVNPLVFQWKGPPKSGLDALKKP